MKRKSSRRKIQAIIFGTALMAEKMVPFIDKDRASISAFIDERPEMKGRKYHDIPVIDLDALSNFSYDCILIATGFSNMVLLKLLQLGVPQKKISSLNFFDIIPIAHTHCSKATKLFTILCREYVARDPILSHCFLFEDFLTSEWCAVWAQQWGALHHLDAQKNATHLLSPPSLNLHTPSQAIASTMSLTPKSIIQNISTIRIETTNICAYNCIFCGAKYMKRTKGTMKNKDFSSLLKRLTGLKQFSGSILLHHSGEPLLDKTIGTKIFLARQAAPQAHIGLNSTLGVPLTANALDSLWERGLNFIQTSFYGYSPEQYKAIHGVDQYDTAKKNLLQVLKSKIRTKHGGRISARILHLEECAQLESCDYEVQLEEFKNMILDHPDTSVAEAYLMSYAGKNFVRKRATNLPCSIAWGEFRRELNITWDWNLVPCCLDSDNGAVLGNLHNESLEAIFSGKQYHDFIQAHWDGYSHKYPACRSCERHIGGNESELTSLAAWRIREILNSERTYPKRQYTIVGDTHLLANFAFLNKKITNNYIDIFHILYNIELYKNKILPIPYIFIISRGENQIYFLETIEKLFQTHKISCSTIIPVLGSSYNDPMATIEKLSHFII